MELNELMRNCLIEANNQYPDLDYVDTVVKAFDRYVYITGTPIEVEDEEEGLELLNKAARFLVDCVLFNLVEKGVIQMAGIDEDGDFIYQLSVEI